MTKTIRVAPKDVGRYVVEALRAAGEVIPVVCKVEVTMEICTKGYGPGEHQTTEFTGLTITWEQP